ncbi:NAD(P)H-dependent glycerol-3-phosphate dehydrogenase [Schaalia suimastitidis]|uniref:NAD(P)H-dependent glycerol-3-phosphate dehydrogenase n=1 Tax=Schaalia suimastitidis TaxID=121163 RepID=UPI00040134DA|nr:NAD(P)H-dependent glycerol-3-phosphate dehydrogenase [Schaalia suimastitidis]
MSETTIERVAILGSGAWGTTFGLILAEAGRSVTIWGRNAITVAQINAGKNSAHLPAVSLPTSMSATTDLAHAVQGADMVVVAVPVSAVRTTLIQASPHLGNHTVLTLLSKGLEADTHATVFDVARETTGLDGDRIAVVSGPNLSREIAQRQPAATVVACQNLDVATAVARTCHTSWFRSYVSQDVVGCEIAGATKNVIAVALGAVEGLGLGANTRSTLITRGLAEITRLGMAMGAQADTFLGLAGVGDLVATCSSHLSRNYSFGLRMGQGMSKDDALAASRGVVEGIRAAEPILALADSLGVDMPITRGVVEVASGRATVEQMGAMLLSRPQKMDGWKITLV